MRPFCAGAGAIAKPKFGASLAFPDSPACVFFSAVSHFQIGKFYGTGRWWLCIANGRRSARSFSKITCEALGRKSPRSFGISMAVGPSPPVPDGGQIRAGLKCALRILLQNARARGIKPAEPLECSRLPYRFPALMTIIRELDPVAADVRPPLIAEDRSRGGSTHLFFWRLRNQSGKTAIPGVPYFAGPAEPERLFYFSGRGLRAGGFQNLCRKPVRTGPGCPRFIL